MSESNGPLVCPTCGKRNLIVVDSRGNKDGTVTRRRRRCLDCEARHTSYEMFLDPTVFTDQRARAKEIARQLREMAASLEVW